MHLNIYALTAVAIMSLGLKAAAAPVGHEPGPDDIHSHCKTARRYESSSYLATYSLIIISMKSASETSDPFTLFRDPMEASPAAGAPDFDDWIKLLSGK